MRGKASVSIQFGIINVPVQVCTATKKGEGDVKLERVSSKTKTKFSQQYVDTEDNVLGTDTDAVYGVLNKGGFVEIPQSSIDAIEDATKVRVLRIERFVDGYAVDTQLYRGFDYLQPQAGAERAFALLAQALRNTNTVAITKWTPRSRQTPCIIRATGKALILQEIYFANEVVAPDAKVTGAATAFVDPDELELAKQLINAKLATEFDHASLVDDKAALRRELLEKALQGEAIARPVETPVEQPPASSLMDELRASLESPE